MPCAAAGVRRNEIIVRFGLTRLDVGRDKGKTALGREERAGGAAVVRGHRKTVFLIFHDLSVLRQTVERILQLVLSDVGQRAADLLDAERLREQRQQPAVKRILLHIFPSDL